MGGAGHVNPLLGLGLASLFWLPAGAPPDPTPPPESAGSDVFAVHPLHLSTAQLLVERTGAFLRIRMFRDDLEQALAAHAGTATFTLEPTPGADSVFLSYFSRAFELEADGSRLPAEVLSSGEDLASGDDDQRMWWYLLGFPHDGRISEISVANRVLFDQFEDQRNIVRILHAPTDRQRTLYFAAPDDDPETVRFD